MITELTDAQRARFPEFVERWTKIGLCTDPMDRTKAKHAIKRLYECGDLKPPKQIIFCGSPLANGIARYFTMKAREDYQQGKDKRATVKPGQSKLPKDVEEKIQETWHAVPNTVLTTVENAIEESLKEYIEKDPKFTLARQVDLSDLLESVKSSVWESVYGQHDAGWLSFYSYMREVVGLVKETDKLEGHFLLAESAGWALPHEDICWVSERHSVLKRNEQEQLHCDGGPAVAYPDGWAIWALNGVRVPKWLAETPASQIEAIQFAKLENAEIRREFIRKVGVERLVQQLGAKVTDRQGDYELLLVDLKGNTGEWPYLKMKNPSILTYHLEAVPRGITTVQAALEWRNGGAFEHITEMT